MSLEPDLRDEVMPHRKRLDRIARSLISIVVGGFIIWWLLRR